MICIPMERGVDFETEALDSFAAVNEALAQA